jgi:ABC-type uncharacterized transport system substrate-binding protein
LKKDAISAYQVFSADDAPERLPALAAELVATKPDVIIAVGPSSIRAAHKATSTIPIVMSFGGETLWPQAGHRATRIRARMSRAS